MEENFDKIYFEELEAQRKINEEQEKIEMAYAKTLEKYSEYQECRSFIDYLRTIEKVFAEAKARNWGSSETEEALIQAKIKVISLSGVIKEDILMSIYRDFKKSGASVAKIKDVANELLGKYKDHPDCYEFILYIEDILIAFSESKESFNLEEVCGRLIKVRMETLSADGHPEPKTLEKIFEDFKDLMKK